MLDAIDRLGVRIVVHGAVGAPQLGTLGANAPELLAGLVERFRVAEVFAAEPWGIAFLRLERRPAAPQGTIWLAPPASGARSTIWPFERVARGGARARRHERDPPADPASSPGDLVLGYGMNPDRWVAASSAALDFEAALERDGGETSLFRERREPQARVDERAWREQRVRLDGAAATLVLRVTAPAGVPVDGDLAGLDDPAHRAAAPTRLIAGPSRDGRHWRRAVRQGRRYGNARRLRARSGARSQPSEPNASTAPRTGR
jgi:hypothetical protein